MEPEKEKKLPSGDADMALDSVVSNMSKVNPDVVTAHEKPEPAAPEKDPAFSPDKPRAAKRKPVKGVTDKHGNPFDPEIHEADTDGKPLINSKDGYLRIKPGRKKNAQAKRPAAASPRPAASPAPAVESPETATQRKYAAHISAALFIRVGMMIFGPEWQPRKDEAQGIDEQSEIAGYFEKYFEVKEINDIPPGAALAIGLIGYGAMRLHLPETKSRMGKIIDAIKMRLFSAWNWMKKIRERKRPVPVPTA